MLVSDKIVIGNNLYKIRKKRGLTQAETAERSNISDKAYADIERGSVNMRIETLLHICEALDVTPDEILTEKNDSPSAEEIIARINDCTPNEKETLMKLITVFLERK